MKQTTIINCTLAGLALVGLQGCAIQGADSFTPTGATLNRSVRVGTDAFKPNPFEAPQQVVQQALPPAPPATIINNNIYNTQQRHEHHQVFRPPTFRNGPGLIVVETPPRPEDQWN